MYHGEKFNSISHLAGVAISIAGASVLVTLAAQTGDFWKITSCLIYGVIAVLLFTSSTLYHSIKGKHKLIFRKIDHIAIYLMIAGTYTPYTLVKLRAGHGWWIFGAVWTLAILGSLQEVTHGLKSRKFSFVIYVFMVAFILLFIQDLLHALKFYELFWLGMGCLLFGIGALFYAYDKKTKHLPNRWAHAHGVWHLFVLVGSFCQYISVSLSILS